MEMTANEPATTSSAGSRNGYRDLHVKAIPEQVWMHARCNATRSGLSFKEYVTRILAASGPLQLEAEIRTGLDDDTIPTRVVQNSSLSQMM